MTYPIDDLVVTKERPPDNRNGLTFEAQFDAKDFIEMANTDYEPGSAKLVKPAPELGTRAHYVLDPTSLEVTYAFHENEKRPVSAATGGILKGSAKYEVVKESQEQLR